MKKRIAYVSGTRADFGLMIPILKAIEKSKLLSIKLYVTGEHLMPELGMTINNVKKYFSKVIVIDAVSKQNDKIGTAKFNADFFKKMIEELNISRPDLMLVLGDRQEMLMVSVACLYLGIPIAHIHGGERTGTVDGVARHTITKIASIHFPATKDAALRIKKMGEEDWRINIVGAPALDTILNNKLPSRKELADKFGINPKENFILILEHPVSEDIENAGRQMEVIIEAVKRFNIPTVIIYPHADAGGKKIIEVIEKEKSNRLFKIFPSLEYKTFLALEREASFWVVNSSAALIESSSFKIPVVNIGNRQMGRQRGNNVLDVDYDSEKIYKAIDKSLNDKKYLSKLKKIKNPWGDGRASSRIIKILEKLEITPKLLNKQINY